MPYLVLVVADDEAQNFSVPPEDEAREVAKIFGLLKVYTPFEILLDGLSGEELFAGRRNLEEAWSDLASNVVGLNSYMKNSSLESALQLMDQENKGMLSKGVLPARLWAKREAYSLNGAPHEKLEESTQFLAQRHAHP